MNKMKVIRKETQNLIIFITFKLDQQKEQMTEEI